MTTRVYGIPNCDTIKKARRWLADNDVEYEFHDYKKLGIDAKLLESWCKDHGHEALINKRGTTWRKLDDSDKDNLTQKKAIALMQSNTSLIKRPVTEFGSKRIIGFDEAQYADIFK